jgi:hypothetical protein
MSLAKRQAFGIIKRAYAKLGRKPVTTPSTLRLIVPLTANRTSFSFPILEGDSNLTHPNQILLNRADAFTATSFGLFLGGLELKQDVLGAYTLDVTSQANLGNEIITQDITLLTAQPQLGVRANTLFQNSLLNISVNNVQYLQNFDIYAANKSNNVSVSNIVAQSRTLNFDSITNGNIGDRDGFVDLVPTLQFSGTSKIDITLNTPQSVLTQSKDLYIEIIFRGFLSLGASNLNK